ncbi:uncharacterized protein [Rutidosis leptorrhynchoides]|uniref:uncharacterized protein n=1 Tax=Rutidosis leptorrhynchoides TaxID=125765 RepID=UPI003A99E472
MASLLLNGSPSSEFPIGRGLRQDDVLFMGEWSQSNASNLKLILDCFFRVSGLKINLLKSSLYGVRVSQVEVNQLAENIDCCPSSLPFHHLGLLVGYNMNKTENWNCVIDKARKRLASWKANLISIGGRLTLLKSVLGAIGT